MLIGISKPIKTIRKNDNQPNKVHRSETTIPCLSQEDNLRMIFQNHFLQKLKISSTPNDDNALFDRSLTALVNEACEELKNGSRTKFLFLNLSDIDEFAIYPNRTIDAHKVLEEEKWKFLKENYKTYYNQKRAMTAYINARTNG